MAYLILFITTKLAGLTQAETGASRAEAGWADHGRQVWVGGWVMSEFIFFSLEFACRLL